MPSKLLDMMLAPHMGHKDISCCPGYKVLKYRYRGGVYTYRCELCGREGSRDDFKGIRVSHTEEVEHD